MITGAKQTLKLDESKTTPTAQVKYFKNKNIPYITPYGFFSSPPVGSTWLIFPLLDNDDNMVGFGNDYKRRPKDLKEADVCLFNTISKAKIVLRTTGDIEIYAPKNVNVNADNDINLTAKKNINITAVEDINLLAKNINSTSTVKSTITAPLLEITAVTTHTGALTVVGTFIATLIKSLTDLIWTRGGQNQSVDIHTHNGGTVGAPDTQ